ACRSPRSRRSFLRSAIRTRREGSVSMSPRLERSTRNRVIAGVCGGIAEYLAIDATVVRVAFVVATFVTLGLSLLAYIVLLILMPLPGQPAPYVSKDAARQATEEPGASAVATTTAAVPPDPAVHAAEA